MVSPQAFDNIYRTSYQCSYGRPQQNGFHQFKREYPWETPFPSPPLSATCLYQGASQQRDRNRTEALWLTNGRKPNTVPDEQTILARKLVHTLVERKRREEIKCRISEIASLLPPSYEIDIANRTYDILHAAIRYIRQQQRERREAQLVQMTIDRLERDNQQLLQQTKTIETNIRYHSLYHPNASCMSQVTDHCPVSVNDHNTDQQKTQQHPGNRPLKTTMATVFEFRER